MTDPTCDPTAFPPAEPLPLADLVEAHKRATADAGLPPFVDRLGPGWRIGAGTIPPRSASHSVFEVAYVEGGHVPHPRYRPTSFRDAVAAALSPGFREAFAARRRRLGITLGIRVNRAGNLVVAWDPDYEHLSASLREAGATRSRPSDSDDFRVAKLVAGRWDGARHLEPAVLKEAVAVWGHFPGSHKQAYGDRPGNELLYVRKAVRAAFDPLKPMPKEGESRNEAATKSWVVALTDALVRHVRHDVAAEFDVREYCSMRAVGMPYGDAGGPLDNGCPTSAPCLHLGYSPRAEGETGFVWRGCDVGSLCRKYGIPVEDYDEESTMYLLSILHHSEKMAREAATARPPAA